MQWLLPPCFRHLGLKVPNPCLHGAGGLPKPTDLHGNMFRLCRDRGQHQGGFTPGTSRPHPHHFKQQSSGIAELFKRCISGLHPHSKLGFIASCALCNIFPESIQKERMCTKRPTPRCPHHYFPILCSTHNTGREQNAGRGNSRVWERGWLGPGSAGAVLGTIVGCDTAGRCKAEILPGMAERAHSVVKDDSFLGIVHSATQKLQPGGEGGGTPAMCLKKGAWLTIVCLLSLTAKPLFFF